MSELSDQGNPANWFSPHQKAILAGMNWTELQLLARSCRRTTMDAESQQVNELKAEVERLKELLGRAAKALDNGDLAILDEMREASK